jgi:hypothetical protein
VIYHDHCEKIQKEHNHYGLSLQSPYNDHRKIIFLFMMLRRFPVFEKIEYYDYNIHRLQDYEDQIFYINTVE